MVRLTTRVETVRELLEKFLDDDSDMHDMNLTARQQDLLDRQTSLIRNSLMRTSLTGQALMCGQISTMRTHRMLSHGLM